MLALAARRCPGFRAVEADICSPGLDEQFDAVVCRGVLNDLIEDPERDDALLSFAGLLVSGGVLLMDLREAQTSQQRADGVWRSTEVTCKDGSRFRFSSRPSWDAGLIVVEERYEVLDGSSPAAPPSDYRFHMRPWTVAEARDRLHRAGFIQVEIEPGVGRRTADRLLVTARASHA